MTPARIAVALVFLLLIGVIVYQTVDCGARSIRLALAEEQCQIFAEMADKAVAALDRDPPATKEAVQLLEYVHNYYPSGTKQVVGSQLDTIVEIARRASESRIIEVLKATTGSDLGNDASVWIDHFRNSAMRAARPAD
jgi:hypothetical protein